MRGRTVARGPATGVMGDDGTVGRRPCRGGGRRLPLGLDGGRSKVARKAVAGGGGRENVLLNAGADGGGTVLLGIRLQGEVCRELGSPEDIEDSSSSVGSVLEVNPPPTPNSSCSSSSSTRCSLTILPEVIILAIEPVRFRLLPYLLRQARPMPRLLDAIEDCEDFRATRRSSMALSKARASLWISSLS